MVKSVAARQPVAVAVGRRRLASPLGLPEEISLIRDIIYDDSLTLALLWWLPSPISTRGVLPRAPDREGALSSDHRPSAVHPSAALEVGAQLEVFLPFHNCS